MTKLAVIFSLIFGIVVVGFGAFFGKNRIETVSQSEAYAATFVDCQYSRRGYRNYHKGGSYYAPVAVSEEGFRAVGTLKISSKTYCENLLGHQATIFVDRNDAEKTRIHSFSQFWMAPFILFSAVIFVISCLFMRQVLATLIFFGAFLTGGTALALEYKVFQGPLERPNLQPVNQEKAMASCLDYAIRKENVEQASQLKNLRCKRRGLTDVTKIARLKSLEKLDLRLNEITNVKPLGTLQNLRELTLDGNHDLQSLEGLEALRGLEVLKVHCADLADIDAVSGLTKLRHLDVSCNKVSSLSPVTKLNSLEKLIIDENPNITTLAPAANKPNLEVITLYRVPVSDISPLFGNEKLRRVNISNNSDVPCAQIEALRSHLAKTAKIRAPKACTKK